MTNDEVRQIALTKNIDRSRRQRLRRLYCCSPPTIRFSKSSSNSTRIRHPSSSRRSISISLEVSCIRLTRGLTTLSHAVSAISRNREGWRPPTSSSSSISTAIPAPARARGLNGLRSFKQFQRLWTYPSRQHDLAPRCEADRALYDRLPSNLYKLYRACLPINRWPACIR